MLRRTNYELSPVPTFGVMWLREVIGMGEYLDANVFINTTTFSFQLFLPRSFPFINIHSSKFDLTKVLSKTFTTR